MAGCKREATLKLRERAPEISALDLNDNMVKLSGFKGKVVILQFWSGGCFGCVAQMPLIDQLSKEYKERGLVVLAVNVGDSKAKVAQLVRKLNIACPVLLDPLRVAATKYRVSAVPATVFVDRNGIAQKMVSGGIEPNQIEQAVGELL